MKKRKTAKNRFNTPKQRLVGLRKMIAPLLLLSLGIPMGIYAYPFLEDKFNAPVSKVTIEGDLMYLERKEVVQNIRVYSDDRLLDVNLHSIRADLESMSWVYSAQVVRRFPGTIAISVVEEKPIARWNQDQLLNMYGTVFDREGKVVKGLPQLSGNNSDKNRVVSRYLEFSQLLSPLGVNIEHLDKDPQGSWTLMLNNEVQLILGNDNILEKMQRFVVLHDKQLQYAPRKVAVVDLRYGNGAAVRWHEESDVAARG